MRGAFIPFRFEATETLLNLGNRHSFFHGDFHRLAHMLFKFRFEKGERLNVGEIAAVSCILRKLTTGRPAMTSDDYYTLQFRTAGGGMGVLEAGEGFAGPFVMSTKVAGTKGGAWIQSGNAFGDPEQVWIRDAGGVRQVEMPAGLV